MELHTLALTMEHCKDKSLDSASKIELGKLMSLRSEKSYPGLQGVISGARDA
jgi:hypothetical protein